MDFGDADIETVDEKSSKSSLLKIPGKGGKQIMKILRKSRKMINNTISTKKPEVEFRQQEEEPISQPPASFVHPDMVSSSSVAASTPQP